MPQRGTSAPAGDLDIGSFVLHKFEPAKLTETTLEVIFLNDSEFEYSAGSSHGQLRCPELGFPFARSEVAAATIAKAETLVEGCHKTSVKPVLALTLQPSSAEGTVDWQPGDTVGVVPRNDAEVVSHILRSLGLEDQACSPCTVILSSSCKKRTAKVPLHIPSPTTPHEVLSDCIDLRGVLKKQFLRKLAECCADAQERSFLNCLSSKDGSREYNELCLERGLTLWDLLELCTSCRPTLGMLVENLPRLLPRPYSIANSPLEGGGEIKIVFSVLLERPGVATRMLDQLAKEFHQTSALKPQTVLMYHRTPNQFRYTSEDAPQNQILIGVGTGLAPFLGFLEHKSRLLRGQPVVACGQTWVFAGATTQQSLLLEGSQSAERFMNSCALQRYFPCLSREPAVKGERQYKYVQEAMTQNGEEFVELLLRPDTVFYVCADGADITKSIEAALRAIIERAMGLEEGGAEAVLQEFRESGKYRVDIWT